jgi:hypothetical protein
MPTFVAAVAVHEGSNATADLVVDQGLICDTQSPVNAYRRVKRA